jgi:hypothetical protein
MVGALETGSKTVGSSASSKIKVLLLDKETVSWVFVR